MSTVPTSVRRTTVVAGVAGVLLLAGCSGAADAEGGGAAASGGSEGAAGTSGTTYEDGSYTAEGSYQTPETVETISVTLTLADGVVTDVEVTGDPQTRESEQYQGQFIDGIADVVEGVAIDELDVSRVAGSSLTSSGFNEAVDAIKEQAAA